MLKWLTVIGSAFLVMAVVLVARYDKFHDTEGKGYDIKCTQSSDPSATMGSLVCTAEHSQKAKSGQYDPLWWHIFFAWPEGITALLLMLTLGAITWQAWETRKAAEAAKATVEAMKEQARDSHQKERARIVVKIVPDESPITRVLWQIKFRTRNIGPTRAFDVWLYAEFEFTSSPVPPKIPQPKMLGRVPRIKPEKWRHFYSGPFFWGDDEGGSNQARMQEVADGKLFLHLRGTVDYQDIFGDWHVTPFRYMWNAGAEPARWLEAVHSEDPKAT